MSSGYCDSNKPRFMYTMTENSDCCKIRKNNYFVAPFLKNIRRSASLNPYKNPAIAAHNLLSVSMCGTDLIRSWPLPFFRQEINYCLVGS
jgi:hypothetical protein